MQDIIPGHGVTEQQAAQPEAPSVGVGGRQPFVAPVRRIDTPADARFTHPIADVAEACRVDAELCLHGGGFQRRQHGFRTVAGTRQGQQIEERLGGPGGCFPGPGDVEWNDAFRREHRLDGRRVFVDVGRQHQHVRRLDVRMLVEDPEQPVMQRFRLPGRRMADVDLEG